MILRLITIILITIILPGIGNAQAETYTIKKAPFSSDKYDEFSPVFYKNGIVFCTNRSENQLIDYSGSDNKGQFNIFYVDTTGNVKRNSTELFSKSLSSKMNDGPATFNSSGDTIYFCRNLMVEGKHLEFSSKWNKLGIFSAVLEGKKWTNISGMRFNNEWYNISTPCLSPDGSKIYFASDKPDGYGGSDIYYSEYKNGLWSEPVNIGPVINTKGNEAYPFINPAGELFFASDGHPGMGGKDIFYSRPDGNRWLLPVRLDPPVNSEYDDFAIITDSLMSLGYFSSNRDNSIDIFRFETNFPQIFYTAMQKENNYCFRFSDTGTISIDTLNLKYVWNFGDGMKASGADVNHCYQDSGKYEVNLDIVDRETGTLFFSKLSFVLNLNDFEQPYINSPELALKGDTIEFDGLKSNLPGYEIISYSWDFGNNMRMQGESLKYTFKQCGEYNIKLGLKLKSLSSGVIHNTGVTKRIVIFNEPGEISSYLASKSSLITNYTLLSEYDKTRIKNIYSAEQETKKDAVFQVVLLSSQDKISLKSLSLTNVPSRYNIKEIYDTETGLYSYIVDQQLNLMAAYPAYREMIASGIKNGMVRTAVLRDPAEKELYLIKKNYSLLTDVNFDASNRLTTSAYIMLDQVVNLTNKYQEIKLEIGVHTDNNGAPANNLWISKVRAQVIVDYLINRGISKNHLTGKGYGETRPVAPNIYPVERIMNRRVDFTIY